GEGNRDGDNNNLSYNYGIEGPTQNRAIERTRLRQIKNMLSTLMLSQGVPMMLSGDECRRTQHGNNNAYCQDNEISWFDWKVAQDNRELLRFVRSLIQFRRHQPTLRRKAFFSGRPARTGLQDVNWYSALGTALDWAKDDRCMICLLTAPTPEEDASGLGRDVLVMVNNSHEPQP
ncbi:MAG: glycogen debranching enzyme, partial [Calditrichaeota bacterium]|nr:glycogen debranching enzyme [Calditrichota bacterium]